MRATSEFTSSIFRPTYLTIASKLPADLEDSRLTITDIQPRLENEQPTNMSGAIHLFKLAQLNSEIKYILHSISHEAPLYTYPNIPDVLQWQRGLITRLKLWFEKIPQFTGDRAYITQLCEIKYHGVMMLLLRPSPAISSPSVDSLKACYESAIVSLRLYEQLYKRDLLVYSWDTVNSIFLSTITMLHCIWTIPEVSAVIKLDVLMADLKAGSNVLSATGEHWSEAKRSRDVLDKLSETTIRWIMDSRARDMEVGPRTRNSRRSGTSSVSTGTALHRDSLVQYTESRSLDSYGQNPEIDFTQQQGFDLNQGYQYFGSNFSASLLGDIPLTDPIDFTNPVNVNAIMHGLFTDLQPIYDFGQDFGMDQIMDGQP